MRTADYCLLEYKRNEEIKTELKIDPIINNLEQYRTDLIQRGNRMEHCRLPRKILCYIPQSIQLIGTS